MRVFISYAAADRPVAKDFAERFRTEGFEVVSEEDEIRAGANFALELGNALARADAMVVILSPDALKSRWVMRDIEYALTNKRFKDRLIPVVARPTRDVPWILKELQMVDLAKQGGARKASKQIVAALKRVDDAA